MDARGVKRLSALFRRHPICLRLLEASVLGFDFRCIFSYCNAVHPRSSPDDERHAKMDGSQ